MCEHSDCPVLVLDSVWVLTVVTTAEVLMASALEQPQVIRPRVPSGRKQRRLCSGPTESSRVSLGAHKLVWGNSQRLYRQVVPHP